MINHTMYWELIHNQRAIMRALEVIIDPKTTETQKLEMMITLRDRNPDLTIEKVS